MKVEKPSSRDLLQWQALYCNYADFYKIPMDERGLNTVWSWIHDEKMDFDARVVKNEQGDLLGFMHFRPMPSPLRGVIMGFLDDLFVAPRHRGSGVVQLLFTELKTIARESEWQAVRWITATDNHRARALARWLSVAVIQRTACHSLSRAMVFSSVNNN